MEPRALRLVYGSTLSENRLLTFLCPPNVAVLWEDTLTELISSIKSEDSRMVWLKDQYLFLYYQDDLCMGPLAADAIKVNMYLVLFLFSSHIIRLFESNCFLKRVLYSCYVWPIFGPVFSYNF